MEKNAVYRNFYRCPDDGTEWQDEWSCMCDDRCPVCNAEIEPYESEDLTNQNEGGVLWKK